MSHYWIGILLFSQSIIFGFLGISNQGVSKSHIFRRNLNNLSDGMLIGLLLFGLIPHVFKHWSEPLNMLAFYLIIPAIGALLLGKFLKKFQNVITYGTAIMFLFHSFVEGIAIGSSFSMLNFTLILTSLLIHKAIESFCFSNQLQQISKEVFFTSFFIILNAVIVIISFYYGISLKDLIFLENTEAYCDLITASSLLFLIVFCNQTQHHQSCSHGWNHYNFFGIFFSMLLILGFSQ